jgi:hypothetical protein
MKTEALPITKDDIDRFVNDMSLEEVIRRISRISPYAHTDLSEIIDMDKLNRVDDEIYEVEKALLVKLNFMFPHYVLFNKNNEFVAVVEIKKIAPLIPIVELFEEDKYHIDINNVAREYLKEYLYHLAE